MDNKLICSSCGYIGVPKVVNKGSGAVELILWLCFIFPGLIYSVWRRSGKPNVCPSCGNKTLIPLNSPIGKELAQKQGKTIEQANEIANESAVAAGESLKKDRVKLLIVAVVVIVILYALQYV